MQWSSWRNSSPCTAYIYLENGRKAVPWETLAFLCSPRDYEGTQACGAVLPLTYHRAEVQICQKSWRIGCVIPRCKLQCGIMQPILWLWRFILCESANVEFHKMTFHFWGIPFCLQSCKPGVPLKSLPASLIQEVISGVPVPLWNKTWSEQFGKRWVSKLSLSPRIQICIRIQSVLGERGLELS